MKASTLATTAAAAALLFSALPAYSEAVDGQEILRGIATRCEEKWGDNYAERLYCQKEELAALRSCIEKWRGSEAMFFQMVNLCLRKEN